MSTMRIRAAALDVTITSEGPDAGSAEVSAVLAQLGTLIVGVEPEANAYLAAPRSTRCERRLAAAMHRRRTA